jgi:hypothetical protein
MIGRSLDDQSHEQLLSRHAAMRMSARRISPHALAMTLRFGRRARVGDGTMYVVGRREAADPKLPPELRALEGLHVLCAPDGRTIITAYRNRSLAGLRAAIRRRRRRRWSRRTLSRVRRRRRRR